MNVKLYVTLAGFLFSCLSLRAQCTDVTLSSQADVDSFASTYGCTTLSGRLLISGNDITNLDGLSALTSIGGLTVTNNPNLANIDGLSSLTTVTGPDARIEFNGNLALANIDGLSSLTTFRSTGTGGWVSFSSNPALKNLDGLFFLHEIRGEASAKLDITFNDALENIDGVSSLTSIVNNNANNRASVSVVGNHALTRGCGLYNLLAGPGGPQRCEPNAEPDDYSRCIDFNISGNGAGVTQESILAGGSCSVTGCNGDINLSSQADVDAFPQNYGCSIVKGKMEIVSINGEITNLDSLYQIVRAKDLRIVQNFYLESIEGLRSLQTVDELLSLIGNKSLNSLHGLENLTTAKDVTIRFLPISDLTGLSALTDVTGTFSLIGNTLSSLQGAGNLASIGALEIATDSTLTNTDAFSSIADIGGLSIHDNRALTSINFSAIQSTGSFTITGNPVLTSLSLPSLQSVTNLSVGNNAMLASLDGFSALTSTSRIVITGNSALTSLQGLSGVTRAPQGIRIGSNSSLPNLHGLEGITTTDNLVIIGNNDALTNLSGLAFTHVGMLWIMDNANLVSLDGLGSLKTSTGATDCECSTIGTRIVNNSKLANLDALSSLETIGGMLQISNNPSLTNLDGLMNLTSIGSNYVMNDLGLDIENNPALVSLSGLQKVKMLGGTFIINNDALQSLYGLHNVALMSGPALRIEGNAALTDIRLSSLKDITTGLVISDNAVLPNMNGLQSLTTISGACCSYISIANNPMLANVDSLTNFVNLTTPQKSLAVVNNPNLTKGCGFYPMLHRYFPCSDCASMSVTFTGNGTTTEEILAEGPCDGSGPVCDNVTLSSQAEVDAYPTTYGCPTVTGYMKIAGNDITNLDSLSMIKSVYSLTISNNPALTSLSGLSMSFTGFLAIDGNDNLADLSGLDSLKTVGSGGCYACSSNGLMITNNRSLRDLDALRSLTSVGGTLTIANNEKLLNIDGLSSLASIGDNSTFNGGSIDINTNPALTNIEGLGNLTKIKGGVSIYDNASLKTLEGLNKLTEIPKEGIYIHNNDSLVSISALSHVTLIWQYFEISDNDRLPNLNGLQSLKQVSVGGPNALIRITNNAALTNVDSLSTLTRVPSPTLELRVTGNTNLTRACGLYPVLVMAFDCILCDPTIIISGNGPGVTEESIRAGGACDGVDFHEPSQPTNLVFSDVTSSSTRLSFTPSPAEDMYYTVLMRTGQSPYPDDAPKDGNYWYPGGVIGNSEVVATGTDTTYVVSGLNANTTYYFAVYAHHNLSYVDDEPLQGSQSTSGDGSPTSISFSNVTDNSMDVMFSAGSGHDGYITLMRAFESALPDEAPENGTSYSIGNVIGCCSIVVGFGTDTVLNVVYLEPDIEYYFDVIPYAINSGSYTYDINAALSGHERTLPRVQPYPNPFVEEVIIPFTINEEESNVRIVIMDQVGRAVSEVVNDRFIKGKHSVRWTRTDMQGNRAGNGVYMYSISTNNNQPIKGLFVAK